MGRPTCSGDAAGRLPGKTTIINELLGRTTKPIAVLVNDAGSVNVDAKLIRRRGRDTIEFTDGCVCCTLSQGLGMAFDQLRARPVPPEHVILEMSGIANPARVAPWTKSAGFVLDGIVVLVDVEQFLANESHDVVGDTLRVQVQAADLLITTKLDLVDESTIRDVRARLHQLAPDTPVIEPPSAFATAGILELGARHDGITVPSPSLFDSHTVAAVPLPDPISEDELVSLLAALDSSVVRAKAIARTPDGRLLNAQVVGHRRTVSELPAPELHEPTDLVVITISAT
ncbi:MAG: GTP-binding protein [Acidimicrobiales bacterium]